MGEALMPRRGESDVAVAIPNAKHYGKDTTVYTSDRTIPFSFSEGEITGNFAAYVSFGKQCIFTALNKRVVYDYDGATFELWFELTEKTVMLHIVATKTKTIYLNAYCGFY